MAVEISGHGLRAIEGNTVQTTQEAISGAYDQVHRTMRPADDLYVDLVGVVQAALALLPDCDERERAMAALVLLHDAPYQQIQLAAEMGARYALNRPNDEYTTSGVLHSLYSDDGAIGFLLGAIPDLDIETVFAG